MTDIRQQFGNSYFCSKQIPSLICFQLGFLDWNLLVAEIFWSDAGVIVLKHLRFLYLTTSSPWGGTAMSLSKPPLAGSTPYPLQRHLVIFSHEFQWFSTTFCDFSRENPPTWTPGFVTCFKQNNVMVSFQTLSGPIFTGVDFVEKKHTHLFWGGQNDIFDASAIATSVECVLSAFIFVSVRRNPWRDSGEPSSQKKFKVPDRRSLWSASCKQ